MHFLSVRFTKKKNYHQYCNATGTIEKKKLQNIQKKEIRMSVYKIISITILIRFRLSTLFINFRSIFFASKAVRL